MKNIYKILIDIGLTVVLSLTFSFIAVFVDSWISVSKGFSCAPLCGSKESAVIPIIVFLSLQPVIWVNGISKITRAIVWFISALTGFLVWKILFEIWAESRPITNNPFGLFGFGSNIGAYIALLLSIFGVWWVKKYKDTKNNIDKKDP